MSDEELRILKNTIGQMASDADDKGLTDFGLRLSVADAFTLCKLKPPAAGFHAATGCRGNAGSIWRRWNRRHSEE